MVKSSLSILNPIKEEEFFSAYFEKRILHVSRNQSKYFNSILSFDDIDDFIASGELTYPFVVLKDVHEEYEFQPWSFKQSNFPSIPVDREQLYKQMQNGKTLILNSLHLKIPKLNHFVVSHSKNWNVKLLANIYITPAKKQGLDWHFDTHDVIILQIKGEKMWELIDKSPTLRDKKTKYDKQETKDFSKVKKVLLKEGDTLYLPRGIYHRAFSEENSSTHIALGIYTVKFNTIFEEFLADSYQQKEFRRSLIGKEIPNNSEEILNEIKKYALNYFNSLKIEEVERVWSRARNILPNQASKGRLGRIINKISIGVDTEVYLNHEINYEFKEEGHFCVIILDGKELKYPSFIKQFLKSVLSYTPIKVGNILGEIPSPQKIQLVEKLLDEGLLLTVN